MKYTDEKLKQRVKELYSKGDTIDQKPAYGCGNIYTLDNINNITIGRKFRKNYINVAVDNVGVWNSDDNVWAPVIKSKNRNYEIF